MVANSAMENESFSRVATLAKASGFAKASADETAAEEHVERVE